MSNLQHFEYNGLTISRRADGYLNASQMCFANGKLFADWVRLKTTKAYLDELSVAMGIPIGDLIVVQNGIQSWIHPSLAINLARWISPKFAVWCDAHIFNLIESGKTSLDIDPLAEMKLKIELARLERDKAALENRTIELRHHVVVALPKPIGDRILGIAEIKEIEYRDRVLYDNDLIRDGSTLTKKQLCDRYGFKTKSGSPDYRRLNAMLEKMNMPSEAWKLSAQILENQEFNRDYLGLLDERFRNGDRQMYLGE